MEIRKRKGGVVYRDEYARQFTTVTVTLYPGDGDTIRVDEIYPDGTSGNELNMFTPDEPDYAKVARYVTHTRGAKKAKKPAKKRRAPRAPKKAAKKPAKKTLREQASCLRQCVRRCV